MAFTQQKKTRSFLIGLGSVLDLFPAKKVSRLGRSLGRRPLQISRAKLMIARDFHAVLEQRKNQVK